MYDQVQILLLDFLTRSWKQMMMKGHLENDSKCKKQSDALLLVLQASGTKKNSILTVACVLVLSVCLLKMKYFTFTETIWTSAHNMCAVNRNYWSCSILIRTFLFAVVNGRKSGELQDHTHHRLQSNLIMSQKHQSTINKNLQR